jgi:hypothetical protein
MALSVAAEMAGRDFAEGLQLALEYAPEPPFAAGRPQDAQPRVLAAVTQRFELNWPERRAAAARAAVALAARARA